MILILSAIIQMAQDRHLRWDCPAHRELQIQGNRYSLGVLHTQKGTEGAENSPELGEGSNGSEKEFQSLINTESCRYGDKTLNY